MCLGRACTALEAVGLGAAESVAVFHSMQAVSRVSGLYGENAAELAEGEGKAVELLVLQMACFCFG